MLRSIISLLFLGVFLISQAQDCNSADECLQQAKAHRFSESSFKIYDKAIKLAKKEGKNLAPFYFQRGVRWYNFGPGHKKEAEKDFKAAIKEDENYYPAYSWIGSIYQVSQKDFDKARKWFDNAVEKFPQDPRPYYDRAHVYRYFNQMSTAFTDFENAYNLLTLLMDGADEFSSSTKGNICRWYAIAYLKKNNKYVHDAKTLEVLETGYSFAPKSPELLGEYAMALYDNGQTIKAEQIGAQARANDATKVWEQKNMGGAFLQGMKAYKNKDLWTAASALGVAAGNLKQPHPAVHYWYAQAMYEYYYSIYDKSPNGWRNNRFKIKKNYELAAKYARNTKYAYLIEYANKNAALIK